MNARNRIFMILGLLAAASAVWYFVTVRPIGDLQLIGTVDANEVLVGSRIAGRIQTLTVEEGQDVKAGDLIAVIESNDLDAAHAAAQATADSQSAKLGEVEKTAQQTRGETTNAAANAQAAVEAAQAALVQTQALADKQQADSNRTIALAEQGVMSALARDQAVTALRAAQAAVDSARHNVAAAEAALRQARSHQIQAEVATRNVATTRQQVKNAQALAEQAKVQAGYAKIYAPVSGKIHVRAARQGEVVSAGSTIVTIMDLAQTWIYAPLPETQADSVQLGDNLRCVFPSGASIEGRIIAKSALADFATQRDVSARKRDIKTVQLKLLIDNPGQKYVPGMTVELYIPKSKLVKP